jgi:SAM-dependent methyltransferase
MKQTDSQSTGLSTPLTTERQVTGAMPAPDRIQEVATGFMAAKFLFVGSEVGLFEALVDVPLGLDALAARLGVPRRTTRILADALVALELLERRDGAYANAPESAAYLAGDTAIDLRPMLRHMDKGIYPRWLQLEAAVRTGRVTPQERQAEQQRLFSEGVESNTRRAALALADRYDFGRHRRLLDLGGGTGSFLIPVLGQASHVAGTHVDLPAVSAIAQQRIADSPVAGRVEFVSGDFFHDPIPEGHDAVLIANIVNGLAPERGRELLRRVRAGIADGGRLLMVGQWTDSTGSRPRFVALMSGTFLLGTSEGEAYSVDEIRDWLTETGWRVVEQAALTGESTLLVAETA